MDRSCEILRNSYVRMNGKLVLKVCISSFFNYKFAIPLFIPNLQYIKDSYVWLSIHCNRIFALKKMYFRVSIYKKRSQVGKSVNGLILIYLIYIVGFSGSSQVKSLSANTGDLGLIPGSKKCPGEGNGNPLQYVCLGNPMVREPGWLQSMRLQSQT